jgi:hypothetical protein
MASFRDLPETLSEVSRTYANLISYVDCASRSEIISHDSQIGYEVVSQRSQTSFLRPLHLLFDCQSTPGSGGSAFDRSVVWMNVGGVHRWDSIGKSMHARLISSRPIVSCLRISFVGIDGEAIAYKIPGLLIPELNFRSLLPCLNNVIQFGQSELDGVVCSLVTCTIAGGTRQLWINDQRLLLQCVDHVELVQAARTQAFIKLRKMERNSMSEAKKEGIRSLLGVEHAVSSPLSIRKITRWHPVLNAELQSDMFEFSVPFN